MVKGVGTNTVFEQYINNVLKRYVISTFCAVARVDLVWSTYKADSLKVSTRKKLGNNIHRRVGPSISCRTEKLARFLVSR